jgi:hypothetical protein
MGFFSGLFAKQNESESAKNNEALAQRPIESSPSDVAQNITSQSSIQERKEQSAQSSEPDSMQAPQAEDSSVVMTKEDIIAAYKIFLKRPPESMDVVMPRVGLSADRILIDFFSSSEFLARPEAVKLIFTLAKKIIDEKAPASSIDTDASTQTAAIAPSASGDSIHKS